MYAFHIKVTRDVFHNEMSITFSMPSQTRDFKIDKTNDSLLLERKKNIIIVCVFFSRTDVTDVNVEFSKAG